MLPEPAGDLAIVAALVSSLRDRPLPPGTLILGEVGLAGEVRAVGQLDQRLAEAAQLGFSRCLLPEGNRSRALGAPLELCGVASVADAMDALFT